jgi:uncharacterized protein YkwD
MIKYCWILSAMMVLSFGCGKKVKEDGNKVVTTPGIVADQCLQYVNKYRINLGLDPLEDSDIITEQSLEHSSAMAQKKRAFGHFQKELRCKRIRNAYGTGWDCGEIVAMGPHSAKDVFNMWLSSNSNRQLIEAAHFTHAGLAFENDRDGVTYWTMMFFSIP